jgi:uncharacterized protein (DUF427 family)
MPGLAWQATAQVAPGIAALCLETRHPCRQDGIPRPHHRVAKKREGAMKATWKGLELAASAQTRMFGGYVYFPREHVRMERLRPSPRTESDLQCPHGVQFYDVVGPEGCSNRAAWSYERPREAMQPIDHWLGFWNDVTVSA